MTSIELALTLLGGTASGSAITNIANYLVQRRKDAERAKTDESAASSERDRVAMQFDAQMYAQHLQELGRLQQQMTQVQSQLWECRANEQTQSREMERMRMRLSQLEYRALTAVVTADANQTIIAWNSSAEELFGWTAAEVVGKEKVTILIPHEDIVDHENAYRRAVAAGASADVMTRRAEAICRDKSRLPIILRVSRRVTLEQQLFITAEISPR